MMALPEAVAVPVDFCLTYRHLAPLTENESRDLVFKQGLRGVRK